MYIITIIIWPNQLNALAFGGGGGGNTGDCCAVIIRGPAKSTSFLAVLRGLSFLKIIKR